MAFNAPLIVPSRASSAASLQRTLSRPASRPRRVTREQLEMEAASAREQMLELRDAADAETASLEMRLEELREELSHLLNERDQLRSQIRQTQITHASLLGDHNQLVMQHRKSEAQIHSLEAELDRLRSNEAKVLPDLQRWEALTEQLASMLTSARDLASKLSEALPALTPVDGTMLIMRDAPTATPDDDACTFLEGSSVSHQAPAAAPAIDPAAQSASTPADTPASAPAPAPAPAPATCTSLCAAPNGADESANECVWAVRELAPVLAKFDATLDTAVSNLVVAKPWLSDLLKPLQRSLHRVVTDASSWQEATWTQDDVRGMWDLGSRSSQRLNSPSPPRFARLCSSRSTERASPPHAALGEGRGMDRQEQAENQQHPPLPLHEQQQEPPSTADSMICRPLSVSCLNLDTHGLATSASASSLARDHRSADAHRAAYGPPSRSSGLPASHRSLSQQSQRLRIRQPHQPILGRLPAAPVSKLGVSPKAFLPGGLRMPSSVSEANFAYGYAGGALHDARMR